jgi:diaminopimelate decarboxylase
LPVARVVDPGPQGAGWRFATWIGRAGDSLRRNSRPSEYVSALLGALQDKDYEVLIEPGRAIVGNAGVLLTRIEYLKSTATQNFAIVDAGMNELLRPADY